MEQLDSIEAQLQETPDKQISLTDPDARSMATSGRGAGMVPKGHKSVTTSRLPWTPSTTSSSPMRPPMLGMTATSLHMAKQAKDAMVETVLHVVADRGYFSSQEILGCQQAGIAPTLPKPATSGVKADGRFGRDHFVYHPGQNEYSCPAGERLKWRYSRIERNMTLHRYWMPAMCP
jgi:hypothetical protein